MDFDDDDDDADDGSAAAAADGMRSDADMDALDASDYALSLPPRRGGGQGRARRRGRLPEAAHLDLVGVALRPHVGILRRGERGRRRRRRRRILDIQALLLLEGAGGRRVRAAHRQAPGRPQGSQLHPILRRHGARAEGDAGRALEAQGRVGR